MSGPGRFRVSYAPRVADQIEAALRWWHRNRRAAPNLLLDEVEAAIDLISEAPAVGRRASIRGHRDVRRVLLRRTGYHLYYRVDFGQAELSLVAFRHARRRPIR